MGAHHGTDEWIEHFLAEQKIKHDYKPPGSTVKAGAWRKALFPTPHFTDPYYTAPRRTLAIVRIRTAVRITEDPVSSSRNFIAGLSLLSLTAFETSGSIESFRLKSLRFKSEPYCGSLGVKTHCLVDSESRSLINPETEANKS